MSSSIPSRAQAFVSTITSRRSIYQLGKKLPIPQEALTTLIQETIKQSPTSFNSQTSRAVSPAFL